MQIKRIIFIFAILVFFSVCLFSVHAVFTNSCYVTGAASCTFGDYGLYSIFDGGSPNAHVSQYPNTSTGYYQVCCNFNATALPYFTSGFCSQGSWFSTYALSNTHVAENKTGSYGAIYNLCAPGGDGYSYCNYRPNNGSCITDENCLGSIDQQFPGNSHIGLCNTLGVNICCSFNTTIQLPGVQIAQFEYWCGAADKVCPERFRDASGNNISCAVRPDPDC